MFTWLLENLSNGDLWAFAGAGLAILLAGIGSSKGVGIAGEAGCGVMSEDPDKFVKVLILEALPSTQGIYGFAIAFLIISQKIGGLATADGLYALATGLPVGIVGLFSGIAQGRVAAAGLNLIAKRDEAMGKAITMTLMVELFALLAFLISFLMLGRIG